MKKPSLIRRYYAWYYSLTPRKQDLHAYLVAMPIWAVLVGSIFYFLVPPIWWR